MFVSGCIWQYMGTEQRNRGGREGEKREIERGREEGGSERERQ